MSRFPTLLMGATALALSACTILPKGSDLPPRLSLDPGIDVTSYSDEQLPVSLVISDPDAEAVYNTSRVAIATAPYQFEYLAGAEWTDRVPVLLRIYLERRFENTNGFLAVGDRTELTSSDYDLKTDLRAFHLDRTQPQQTAQVSYGARLTDGRGRTIASRIFEATAVPTENGRLGEVQALNEATREVADATLLWVREQIAQRRAAAAAAPGEQLDTPGN